MCDNLELMKEKDEFHWKYLMRQILVNSGVWAAYFIFGLSTGIPTVLVPQLRNEANSTDAVTPEQASWLPSAIYYSALPWTILLPIISEFAGRKITYAIMCISSLIGFIIFWCSSVVHQIIISEIFQGIIVACNLTMSVMICTEYISSKYRGMFLTMNIASFYWAVLVANVIGTFLHWKYLPALSLACTFYCLFIVYFWPESPLWLAKKGYFDKCAQAHSWLKGSNNKSEKELKSLLANNQHKKNKMSLKLQAINSFKFVNKKKNCKPLLLSFLSLLLYMLTGKHICSIYAIEILKKISTDKSTVYMSMLILDTATVVSMYVGCILAKIFRRRPLLFSFTIISEIFLFSLSAYLYLIKLSIVSDNIYVTLPLFVGFSIAVSCGPMILSVCISGELIPSESRSTALCITAVTFKAIHGTYIKISPYIFEEFGMHGTFFLFGLTSTICLVLLYFYLPETKDKTLQEIAENFQGPEAITEGLQSTKAIAETNQLLVTTYQ